MRMDTGIQAYHALRTDIAQTDAVHCTTMLPATPEVQLLVPAMVIAEDVEF